MDAGPPVLRNLLIFLVFVDYAPVNPVMGSPDGYEFWYPSGEARQGFAGHLPMFSKPRNGFTGRLPPTSSSWLNLVERWFRELSPKRIRRGVFHSLHELVQTIQEYLEQNNKEPKPFVWTASVQKILAKVQNCRAIFETLH